MSLCARAIEESDLMLPIITNEQQRLSIDMHLIDSETKIIHAIKLFSLSPELTRKFLCAVQEQLLNPVEISQFYQKYINQHLDEIVILADLKPCDV